jgi:hypothetical protein
MLEKTKGKIKEWTIQRNGQRWGYKTQNEDKQNKNTQHR